MSKKVIEFLSKNAYAKYLGVNEKAIRNAVADGKIKKGWDVDRQKIIKHLADKEYGFLHVIPKVGPGVSQAKVIEKIQSEEKPDKVAKVRTESQLSSDVKKEIRKSEQSLATAGILSAAELKDISKMETSDLLKLLEISADMDYKAALTANIIIDAALKKKKLEEMEDVLVRRLVVESALYSFGSALKKDLLAIPSRVTDDIMLSANKVEGMTILLQEITAVLEKHSTQNIKVSNKV